MYVKCTDRASSDHEARTGSAQGACDLAQPEPPLFHARNRQALVGLQLAVARSLRVQTSPGGRVLHFRFEVAMLDSVKVAA